MFDVCARDASCRLRSQCPAVLVGAVIAFLPASLIDGRVASATQGKVRLADSTGTVWDGRGVLTDSAGTWRVPMGWTVSKADVLRGKRVVVFAVK